jgi:hypothetical protein
MYLRVCGTVGYYDVRYCGCEFCKGHGSGDEITVEVDVIVCAASEASAVGMVEDDLMVEKDVGELEWKVGPDVVLAPPDRVMRLIGAPTLL